MARNAFNITAVLLLLVVVIATPAKAMEFPGERPLTDPLTNEEISLALRFWQARNVIGCPNGIQASIVPSLAVDGQPGLIGAGGNCAIWLREAEFVADRTAARWRRDLAMEDQCAVVVHEVGHALGLPHTTTGIMTAEISEAPWDCRQWAKRWAQRRRTDRKSKRHRSRPHAPSAASTRNPRSRAMAA